MIENTIKISTTILFCRLPVSSVQCIIGTERYPDSAILINFDDDGYSQGHGQSKEAFGALTKNNILQPFMSEDDYRASNDGDDNGYNIHAFDIRYQKKFGSAQPIKVEFKFPKNITPGKYGFSFNK